MKMLSFKTNFQVWNICREKKRFYVSQNMHLFNCVSLSEIHNVNQQMLLWLQQHLFPAPFPENFIFPTQTIISANNFLELSFESFFSGCVSLVA